MSAGITSPLRKVFEPLKEKAVDLLTEAILSGKLRPGDKVNESQLARQLQVSRAPIREALQQLQEQGLIVNVPRRGMFVVSLDEEGIQKINSLRVVLEAEALRLARTRLTPQGEKRLSRLIERMERMDPVPPNRGARLDFEFHRTIWDLTGNEFLEKTLVSLTAPVFAHSVLSLLRTEKLRRVLDSHRPLFEYVRGNLSRPAEEVMLEHLSIRYRDPGKYSSMIVVPSPVAQERIADRV